jgi:hypothetical protein
MNKPCHAPRLNHQHAGFGALAVMLLLLFGSSIIVFYLNRGLIFEQKTSANQMRSTTAFEVAEAGLEWATGMLNSPQEITTACALTSSTTTPFRQKYLQVGGALVVTPAMTTYPGCKINGTTLSCSCPDLPSAGNEAFANPANTAALPSFTVSFEATGDPQAVRVTSTGCTAQASGGVCRPNTAFTPTGATTGNSDAWAQVSVILKLRPLLRAAPTAALTCGTSCAVGGAYTISNTDVASNGYLVDAGTTLTSSNYALAHYETIPGQPVENALVADDQSLAAIAGTDPTCNNSAMFRTFFGTSIAEYAASPQVRSISCSTGPTCRTAVENAYAAGWRNFYFPIGLQFTGNWTLGSSGPGNSVNIVTPGDFDITGNFDLYGLVYSNSANVNDVGTGTANIYGAMITCRGYNNNGSGRLEYDGSAYDGNVLRPGVMVRVPGSWRDFTP